MQRSKDRKDPAERVARTRRSARDEHSMRVPEMLGFDVYVEQNIGHVSLEGGEEHPHVAAFRLIAEHGTEGIFRFHSPESIVQVTVEHL